MAAISTAPNALDRKFHRIILESDPGQSKTVKALAGHIAGEQYEEFSYSRLGKIEYSKSKAIEHYVSCARDIGLLDDELMVTRPKKEVRSLENFQQWLADLVFQYLSSQNASLDQIKQAMGVLITGSPCRLTTQENIRAELHNPPSLRNFRFCLTIVSLLRPGALALTSHRVVLIKEIIEG